MRLHVYYSTLEKTQTSWAFSNVVPAGIEPASQLPQSCVLSIERRDQTHTILIYTNIHITASKIKTL